MARCGVRPVVLMPILRRRGRCRWNISTISGRSFRVVGSPPEMFRFSTAPQNGSVQDRLELGERHVGLAIAPLPVVAHRALGVADPGAVVDEHRRPDRVELRADEGIDEVAGDAGGGLCEVLQPEGDVDIRSSRPVVVPRGPASRTPVASGFSRTRSSGVSRTTADDTTNRRRFKALRSVSYTRSPLRLLAIGTTRRRELDPFEHDRRLAVDPDADTRGGWSAPEARSRSPPGAGSRAQFRRRGSPSSQADGHQPRRPRTLSVRPEARRCGPTQRARYVPTFIGMPGPY